ncbi:MAG: gliding motility-associated C-terminal domain-containing protein, partial [Bacteroidota bacterium]|nr:gliding motility-associated C-terminal domain-containing protein [Bacteroidota bacterium]
SGQLPITLSVENVLYVDSYTWQNGSQDPTFEVQTGGAYSVTVFNSCFTVSDDIEVITQNIPPLVELPFDQMLCEGQTLVLTSNGVAGNYVWQDGSTGTEFLVTGPGTYSLTVTDACGVGIDNVIIGYVALPVTPDLGTDILLCPGEVYTLYATESGVNYNWQNGSNADSLNVNTGGSYWLEVSNMCGFASDTVDVIINDTPPSVDLPASLSICDGQSVLIESGISGVTFLWSDGSNAPALLVSSAGTYSLTVSNSCGSANDAVTVIDLGPLPTVTLGGDTSLCSGDAFQIIPSSSNVDSWLWQDGSTNSDFNVSAPGQIIANVTNSCGVVSDTLEVTGLTDVASLDLGQDTSICAGETFTITIPFSNISIEWNDGSVQPDYLVTIPGQVYATISNECGTSADTININQLPDVPGLGLGNDQPLCPGETIIINPGIINVTYLWQDGSSGTTYTTMTSGDIILTIANDCGVSIDTVTIYDDATGPSVDLGPDVLACEGDMITLAAGIGGVSYLWQDGSINANYTAATSGLYFIQVSNACGVDADSVQVTISDVVPSPTIGPDTSLCEGVSLQLISLAAANTSIEWQDGSSLSTFMVTQAGIYSLTETNHCGTASDTMLVSYTLAPLAFDIGIDTTICDGESIILIAPITTDLLTWQDGTHNATYVADQTQPYSLTVSNNCGTYTDLFNLLVDTRTPVIDVDPTISICEGEVVILDVTQLFSAEYLWNDGSVLPMLTISAPGSYSVNVSTPCIDADQTIQVVYGLDCIVQDDIYIPDVFSPNGDNINDFFTLTPGPDLEISGIQCQIFDRWGNLIYERNSMPVSWDGTFRADYLNPGVYAYLINLGYNKNGELRSRIFAGSITLIR